MMTDLPRPLDAKVAVAPQITPEDLPGLREQGFKTIVCNRPDMEVPPDLSAEVLRVAALAEGMVFIENPLSPGTLDLNTISSQRDAILGSDGPVLAYCASGTRSAVLWAFAMAMADKMPTPDLLEALDRAGYPMPGLGGQLDQVRGSAT